MSEHVTPAEFARIAQVNRSTVHRWIKRGRITLGADGLIDKAKALRERTATESPLPHHQARKAQIDRDKQTSGDGAPQTEASPAVESVPGMEKLGAAMRFETYKLQKAKAEAANIELDKLAGALVERAEIDYVVNDIANTLRGMIERLPDRIAPTLAAHRGNVAAIHTDLEGVLHDLLEEFSDLMDRKSKEVMR